MRKQNIEILAPAGNIESFKAAINAGADAIYMGLGKHNARVMAKNFGVDDYIYCLNYAHIRNVKVYLTLNTLVEDDEIEEALQMLVKLYEHGLDAVIIQDLGLATLIHKLLPNLPMHASTQMSVYSIEQVRFLEKMGFERVVLARELTLDEIKNITNNTNVQIEAFVHGALCVCVSGQCLLSLNIGTRSANRGACAQPCRMRYTLSSNTNKGILKNAYLLSKKDIFALDILNDVLDADFLSLKIEGRNKSPEYVAQVVSLYRKYVDIYKDKGKVEVDPADEKKILQVFNRSGKSHGYLKGVTYKNSITPFTPKNTGLKLGKVLDKKGKFVKVKLEEDIDMHDGIEIYSNSNVVSNVLTCIKNEKGNIINKKQEKGSIVYLGDFDLKNVVIGDEVYKTSSNSLNNEIGAKYLQKSIRKREMTLSVNIKENSPITLSTIINQQMYIYNTNIIPEKAINKELTLEDLSQCFNKTQDFGIKFNKVVGFIQKGLFVKVSVLNDIRRNFVSKVEEKLYVKNDVNNIEKNIPELLKIDYNDMLIQRNINSIEVYNYLKEKDYKKEMKNNASRIVFQIYDVIKYEEDIVSKYSNLDLGINISNFELENVNNYILDNIERLIKIGFKTFVLGSFRYYELLKELKQKYNITLIADYTFNVTNSYSAMFLSSIGIDVITPGIDASSNQIEKLAKIVDLELVDDYIQVMTSRYCIIGSFVANRKENEKCCAPCMKDTYYLTDTYGKKYYLTTNSIDCVMRILSEYNLDENKYLNIAIRHNII